MKTSHLADFPDRFSPMLVKELRQGMRARTFTAVFLGLQLLLGLLLLGAMLASHSERTGSIVSGIVFTFFVVAVVMIQPLRGITALSGEMRDQTIDLMVLTRLTSWRIVLGKWVAIVSQSALLLVTIIPYLILRYFFGGMNLVGEITILLCLFAVSMALTALTVGLSACRLAVARILVPIAIVLIMFVMLMVISVQMSMSVGGGGMFGGPSPVSERVGQVLLLLTALAYFGYQSLSLGASLIAPAAENHAIVRRIITMVSMIIIAAIAVFFDFGGSKALWFVCIPLVVAPALIIALTESCHVAPGVIAGFRRRGIPGLVAAAFLIPGRASGYLFSLLVVGMVFGLMLLFKLTGETFWDDEMIRLLGIWGSLLFPAVVLRFLQRGEGQRIGGYLLILLTTLVFWLIVQSFAQATGEGIMLLFVWCPIVFTLGDVDAFASTEGIALILAVLLVMNLSLAIGAVLELKGMLQKDAPASRTSP